MTKTLEIYFVPTVYGPYTERQILAVWMTKHLSSFQPQVNFQTSVTLEMGGKKEGELDLDSFVYLLLNFQTSGRNT